MSRPVRPPATVGAIVLFHAEGESRVGFVTSIDVDTGAREYRVQSSGQTYRVTNVTEIPSQLRFEATSLEVLVRREDEQLRETIWRRTYERATAQNEAAKTCVAVADLAVAYLPEERVPDHAILRALRRLR